VPLTDPVTDVRPRILVPALRQAPARPLSGILRQKHEGASRRTPSCQPLSGLLRPFYVAILFVSGRSNWVGSRRKARPPPRPRSRPPPRLVRVAPSRNCAPTLPARASPPCARCAPGVPRFRLASCGFFVRLQEQQFFSFVVPDAELPPVFHEMEQFEATLANLVWPPLV
jgi:hypothetical protein